MQKLSKCQAERLGCRDQVVLLKVGGSASALRAEHIDKGSECFIRANTNNQSKLFTRYLDSKFLWKPSYEVSEIPD